MWNWMFLMSWLCAIEVLMLKPWKVALSINEQNYLNLVRSFYLNMEIFADRLDRIITNVRGVRIEFEVEDLNQIIGTEYMGSHRFILLVPCLFILTYLIVCRCLC